MMKKTAVLDACVLYPAPLRDFLLNLAYSKLFQPKWTKQIQDEWTRNLLKNRKDLNAGHLIKTVKYMNNTFADANVEGYENIINGLNLPDPDDRHVLAAAIKSNADYIVTINLKDFTPDQLTDFNINAIHPDDFICDLIKIEKQTVIETFHYQVKSLINPPLINDDLLFNLKKCGLKKSVIHLKEFL